MINTIDIDNGDKANLNHIVSKLASMDCLIALQVSDSSRKGYHIKMWCHLEGCDLCRFCYDDPVRFSFDQYRPKESQNVLWSEKIPYHKSRSNTLAIPCGAGSPKILSQPEGISVPFGHSDKGLQCPASKPVNEAESRRTTYDKNRSK